jgi:hypothetical protein
MLTLCVDESYDGATMCVGGWLCTESAWAEIEAKWLQRVVYEARRSGQRGHAPIRRYHATDCSNLKREYKSWDIPRQITFAKRLTEILGNTRPKPIGFAVGLAIADLKQARSGWSDEVVKAARTSPTFSLWVKAARSSF